MTQEAVLSRGRLLDELGAVYGVPGYEGELLEGGRHTRYLSRNVLRIHEKIIEGVRGFALRTNRQLTNSAKFGGGLPIPMPRDIRSRSRIATPSPESRGILGVERSQRRTVLLCESGQEPGRLRRH